MSILASYLESHNKSREQNKSCFSVVRLVSHFVTTNRFRQWQFKHSVEAKQTNIIYAKSKTIEGELNLACVHKWSEACRFPIWQVWSGSSRWWRYCELYASMNTVHIWRNVQMLRDWARQKSKIDTVMLRCVILRHCCPKLRKLCEFVKIP